MSSDKRLETRIANLEEVANQALDEVAQAVDSRTGAGSAERSPELEVLGAGLTAIALELRAVKLAVLAREPFKWWW